MQTQPVRAGMADARETVDLRAMLGPRIRA